MHGKERAITIIDETEALKRIHSRQGNGNGNGFSFLKAFLKHPALVGSIIPSSRFAKRRLVTAVDMTKAKLVLELGPGTGGTTQAFLDAMPKNSKLLAIEIMPEFVSLLKDLPDPRLIVHQGSAEHIREALKLHRLAKPQIVISGIPFSTMPPEVAQRIIKEIWSCLAPGGKFVAYQFRGQVSLLGSKLLGKPKVEVEFLNVPPIRVYQWQKPGRG